MATSALAPLIDAVIARFRSDSNLVAAKVRIFDGIEIDGSYPGSWIAVGHDGNTEGDDVDFGSFTQDYTIIGARGKFEDGSINCTLAAWDGGTNLTTVRTLATQILGYVENSIRSDVSFGGVVIYSGLDQSQMSYKQTTSGAGVQINFTISYRAKI